MSLSIHFPLNDQHMLLQIDCLLLECARLTLKTVQIGIMTRFYYVANYPLGFSGRTVYDYLSLMSMCLHIVSQHTLMSTYEQCLCKYVPALIHVTQIGVVYCVLIKYLWGNVLWIERRCQRSILHSLFRSYWQIGHSVRQIQVNKCKTWPNSVYNRLIIRIYE